MEGGIPPLVAGTDDDERGARVGGRGQQLLARIAWEHQHPMPTRLGLGRVAIRDDHLEQLCAEGLRRAGCPARRAVGDNAARPLTRRGGLPFELARVRCDEVSDRHDPHKFTLCKDGKVPCPRGEHDLERRSHAV